MVTRLAKKLYTPSAWAVLDCPQFHCYSAHVGPMGARPSHDRPYDHATAFAAHAAQSEHAGSAASCSTTASWYASPTSCDVSTAGTGSWPDRKCCASPAVRHWIWAIAAGGISAAVRRPVPDRSAARFSTAATASSSSCTCSNIPAVSCHHSAADATTFDASCLYSTDRNSPAWASAPPSTAAPVANDPSWQSYSSATSSARQYYVSIWAAASPYSGVAAAAVLCAAMAAATAAKRA
jgi:hypothetical protein